MQFIPIPNVMMAELLYSDNISNFENVLYFKKDAGVLESDPHEVALFLKDWWTANLAPICAGTTYLRQIDVVDLSVEDSFFYSYAFTPVNGGALTPALPKNVTLAVKFSTNRSGRSYRGRNYAVGLTEGKVVGDTAESDYCEALRAAYEELIDAAFTAGYTWVVASRYQNKLPRAIGISTEVENVSVEATIDSQRRRLKGRGK